MHREYVPSGPCEISRVRQFSEAKLRALTESPALMNDKTKFMDWMESLTNDILGISSERSSITARQGKPLPSDNETAPSSSSSSSSLKFNSGYISQPIDASMREPSYTALGKLQQIRQNVANMLGDPMHINSVSSPERPAYSSRPVKRQLTGSQLHLHQENEKPDNIRSEYPFSQTAAASSVFEEQNENVDPAASLQSMPAPRGALSPARHPRDTRESQDSLQGEPTSSIPEVPAATVTSNASAAPTIPESANSYPRKAVPAAAPRTEDGELDFSGTWKSARGDRGRYQGLIDTTAQSTTGGVSSLPRTTITLRGSVDLSGMSLEGLKGLTGHY